MEETNCAKIQIELNINLKGETPTFELSPLCAPFAGAPANIEAKPTEGKPLSAYTVKEIKEIEARGDVEKYFKVGDMLDIKLDDGEILTVAIADFYHDTDKDGNLVPITFTAVNVLEESCSMDDMDDYLDNLFNKRLPEDIRSGIIPVQKDGKLCKLFLHSEMEIFGKTVYSKDNTGKQYPYYAQKCHRCKFRNSADYSAYWWGRSASSDTSLTFCFVSYYGSAYSHSAYYSYGVAPAFGF